MITVYHNKRFTDLAMASYTSDIGEKFKELECQHSLEKVAEVQTDDLDDAFRDTNHIDRAWYENDNVKVIKESRSTSVGDVMELGGKRFIVASLGFKELI